MQRRHHQRSPAKKDEGTSMFWHIHRDVYSVIVGLLILAGLITWLLVTVNPIR